MPRLLSCVDDGMKRDEGSERGLTQLAVHVLTMDQYCGGSPLLSLSLSRPDSSPNLHGPLAKGCPLAKGWRSNKFTCRCQDVWKTSRIEYMMLVDF